MSRCKGQGVLQRSYWSAWHGPGCALYYNEWIEIKNRRPPFRIEPVAAHLVAGLFPAGLGPCGAGIIEHRERSARRHFDHVVAQRRDKAGATANAMLGPAD